MVTNQSEGGQDTYVSAVQLNYWFAGDYQNATRKGTLAAMYVNTQELPGGGCQGSPQYHVLDRMADNVTSRGIEIGWGEATITDQPQLGGDFPCGITSPTLLTTNNFTGQWLGYWHTDVPIYEGETLWFENFDAGNSVWQQIAARIDDLGNINIFFVCCPSGDTTPGGSQEGELDMGSDVATGQGSLFMEVLNQAPPQSAYTNVIGGGYSFYDTSWISHQNTPPYGAFLAPQSPFCATDAGGDFYQFQAWWLGTNC